MKRDIAQAPKRVRRFQSQTRWKGTTRIGKTHVGKRQLLGGPGGYVDWTPACAKPEQLAGLRWFVGGAPGRVLSAGATAPITCRDCLKLLAVPA